MTSGRVITYSQAINEGTAELMREDETVLVMGLGVPGPTGVFGTTSGLLQEFGTNRVLDTPAAENGMTGVALGMAISGLRPILVHHRVDFAILSLEPIVNQAAKWFFMYGGKATAPLTIRMIIGRGWGQGPQHSQSLQAWFAHIPGLQTLMPATPSDAKGMLKAAVQSSAPTVILEHRWLYDITGEVEEGSNPIPLGKAIVRTEGNDVTIVAASYMVIEAMRAAEILTGVGISVEVVDLRTISPLDKETIINSVTKTGRVVVADTGSISFGISAEILACISEEIGLRMRSKPIRIALPDIPTPTSHALTRKFYPTSVEITQAVMVMFGVDLASVSFPEVSPLHDVPSKDFTGPY